MTIELTDEDWTTIGARADLLGGAADDSEPFYRAGIRAGMERAAKLCDGYVTGRDDTTVAMLCAEAIREAAK